MPDVSLTQQRRLLSFFKKSIREHPSRPVLISEGDSWFSFPIHRNIIDHLDSFAKHKLSLLRLESSGDEFLNIMTSKQKNKLRRYLKAYPVQALLISGGGNDVGGGDLLPLLEQKRGKMTWEDCIHKTRARTRIRRLRDAYSELIDIRDDHKPDCVIYTHGYDYALPTGTPARYLGIRRGPWLKPPLAERGITNFSDQKKIVRWLMKEFNAMLEDMAGDRVKIVYVKTPGTLRATEWSDELHPTQTGFERIAKKFRTQLKKQFPDGPW